MLSSGQDGSSIQEQCSLCQPELLFLSLTAYSSPPLYRKYSSIFVIVFVFSCRIFSIGHDFKKGPMKSGCRKWIIYFMYHVCCTFYLFIAGTRTSLKFVDVDYSYYLGPNYKNNVKKIKRTSTIVCNHVSWLDPVVLIKNVRPAFAPSSEFKTVPVLSTLIDCIDSIYIPRGGSEE